MIGGAALVDAQPDGAQPVEARPGGALPVVAVGAGGMGRTWLAMLAASPEVDLVGVVDLDLGAARSAVTALGTPDLPTAADAVELARATGARAVIDVTVPQAHHPVTTAALFAGLSVLGEKPAAATLAQALSLAAAAEVAGPLFMVSQSRRWNPQLAALRAATAQLGAVGAVTTTFFKSPRFGGFREEMAQPLLVDMAIHQFDMARHLTGADPVAVRCESWNPPWSWFSGDASATAVFELEGGARYTFTGSWCAPGDETSWNGDWRVTAAGGTATWDGDHEPVVDASVEVQERERSTLDGISGSLAVFCEALRSGETPPGEVHENVLSLAMVEAAVLSAQTGGRVVVDDVLEQAREEAVAGERRDDVREVMTGWGAVRGALAAASWHRRP